MSAGAEIRIHRDPLRPGDYERREIDAGLVLIEWLFAEYPAGFGRPVVLHLNGAPLAIEDADCTLNPGDIVHVLVQPGGQVVGALIVKALVTAAISAVASIAFNLIFKPKRPNAQEMPAPDPIYSITGAQNAARLGEPVPVLYGQMVTVPDYASQPYTFFDGNNQYLDQILVIGQGIFDVLDVIIGETPVSAMESSAVQVWMINETLHGQTMGNIEAVTGIMENVVSSAEVADQEINGAPMGDVVTQSGDYRVRGPNQINLVSVPPPAGYPLFTLSGTRWNDGTYTLSSYDAGNQRIYTVENNFANEDVFPAATISFFRTPAQQTTGPFITSKAGQRGNRIMLDFVWPNGLYRLNSKSGALENQAVTFSMEWQMVDDAGNPVGGWGILPMTVAAATNTPVRRTFFIDVAPGRYRVRVTRSQPPPATGSSVSNFIWTGLRFRLVNTLTPVYGPVTLLAVRIKATNGVSSGASGRIRVKVQRHLPPMGSGALMASRSPADAFCDVLTNPTYGAKRPLAEVDLAELTRIAASWGGLAKFDGGFAQRSTIWEALNIALQTANAAPLPLGNIMSLAQEGVKASRRQLFTDANMARGTLAIGYSFDKPGDPDGIQVEYRDPATWNALYVTYPPGALDPDQVQLFGCSDPTQAGQFARLLWQKRVRLRKTANFETELEGLLARMGDKIGVAAALPRWGMSGVVVGYSGQTLWLDKPPDWTGSGHQIILRDQYGQPSDPIVAIPGPEPNSVQLATPAPFPLFGTGMQESTHYTFGDSVQLIRDFTVQTMEPRGGTLVAIEALLYDPAAYADTLPWVENPT